MAAMAAVSIATTVFGYFSPTKSPYYATIAAGTGALVYSREVHEVNWTITFVPLVCVLGVSTLLSFFSRPSFTSQEYNNQLKFARSFGISSAIICLVYGARMIRPERLETLEGQAPLYENTWIFLTSYSASLLQLLLFLFYIFVFHNYESKQKGQNFVQLSLVVSTFLIGATYAATTSEEGLRHDAVLVALYALWLSCAAYLCVYLVRNLRLAPPLDAESEPLSPEDEGEPETQAG